MKHKRLLYAFLPVVLGVSLLGVSSASAHGFGGFGMGMGFGAPNLSADEVANRQQQMFEQEAKVLGISVEDVKSAWAAGKTMQDLMTEKNISEATVQANLKAQRDAQIKSQLDTLVSKGIITQAQADQRLKAIQNLPADRSGRMGRHGGMFGFRL